MALKAMIWTFVSMLLFYCLTAYFEVSNYFYMDRQLQTLAASTSHLAIANFQDKDDTSILMDSGYASDTYNEYLAELSNHNPEIATFLSEGLASGFTPDNLQLAYMDGEKLQTNIEDFIETYWTQIQYDEKPMMDLVDNVKVKVDVVGPDFLSISQAGMKYYGYTNSLENDASQTYYGDSADFVVSYRVSVTVSYDILGKNKMAVSLVHDLTGNDIVIPGESTYTENYSLFN